MDQAEEFRYVHKPVPVKIWDERDLLLCDCSASVISILNTSEENLPQVLVDNLFGASAKLEGPEKWQKEYRDDYKRRFRSEGVDKMRRLLAEQQEERKYLEECREGADGRMHRLDQRISKIQARSPADLETQRRRDDEVEELEKEHRLTRWLFIAALKREVVWEEKVRILAQVILEHEARPQKTRDYKIDGRKKRAKINLHRRLSIIYRLLIEEAGEFRSPADLYGAVMVEDEEATGRKSKSKRPAQSMRTYLKRQIKPLPDSVEAWREYIIDWHHDH